MKKQMVTLSIMFLMLIILTGCAKGAMGVTVNKNGSIDLSMNLEMDARIEKLVGKSVDNILDTTMRDWGIQVTKNQSDEKTEYKLLRSYASLQEMRGTVSDFKGIDIDMEETNKLLFTKYRMNAQVDLTEYELQIAQSVRSLGIPNMLSQLILKQFAFDFSLELPIDLYGDHNADVTEGNKLTWHISLADPEPIQMEIYVPNIKNICIVAASVLLIVILVVIYYIRRKRQSRGV